MLAWGGDARNDTSGGARLTQPGVAVMTEDEAASGGAEIGGDGGGGVGLAGGGMWWDVPWDEMEERRCHLGWMACYLGPTAMSSRINGDARPVEPTMLVQWNQSCFRVTSRPARALHE